MKEKEKKEIGNGVKIILGIIVLVWIGFLVIYIFNPFGIFGERIEKPIVIEDAEKELNPTPDKENETKNDETTEDETVKPFSNTYTVDSLKSNSIISSTLKKEDYNFVKFEKNHNMETLYYKVNISIEDGDLVAINKDNNKATFSFKNAENFIQGKDSSLSVDGERLYVITEDGKLYYTAQPGKGSFTDVIKGLRENDNLNKMFTLFDYPEKVVDVYYYYDTYSASRYVEPVVETESGKFIGIDTYTGKLTEYVD